MRQHIIYTVFIVLCLVGCKKEYTVEIERMEIYNGTYVKKDYKTEKFKAKNDEEATAKAYRSYLIGIRTAYQMSISNSNFLWIPVDYKIEDSKGNSVSRNILDMDEDDMWLMTPEIDDYYYTSLGYFKYIATPYGARNPKPSPF